MAPTIIVHRLRVFLLALAGCMCIGTVAELWLTEHIESLVQLIPFVLCGLGLLVLGALIGAYEHVEHNLAFELEIRPGATPADVWFDALRGASPLLAPGILGLAAVIALAATYYHPALLRVRRRG